MLLLGSAPFRSLISGDARKLKYSHGIQSESDCLDIKSIRRPLAPQTASNHGIKVHVNYELLSKPCAVPHRIRTQIVRREAARLNTLEKLKKAEKKTVHLDDAVGMHARLKTYERRAVYR